MNTKLSNDRLRFADDEDGRSRTVDELESVQDTPAGHGQKEDDQISMLADEPDRSRLSRSELTLLADEDVSVLSRRDDPHTLEEEFNLDPEDELTIDPEDEVGDEEHDVPEPEEHDVQEPKEHDEPGKEQSEHLEGEQGDESNIDPHEELVIDLEDEPSAVGDNQDQDDSARDESYTRADVSRIQSSRHRQSEQKSESRASSGLAALILGFGVALSGWGFAIAYAKCVTSDRDHIVGRVTRQLEDSRQETSRLQASEEELKAETDKTAKDNAELRQTLSRVEFQRDDAQRRAAEVDSLKARLNASQESLGRAEKERDAATISLRAMREARDDAVAELSQTTRLLDGERQTLVTLRARLKDVLEETLKAREAERRVLAERDAMKLRMENQRSNTISTQPTLEQRPGQPVQPGARVGPQAPNLARIKTDQHGNALGRITVIAESNSRFFEGRLDTLPNSAHEIPTVPWQAADTGVVFRGGREMGRVQMLKLRNNVFVASAIRFEPQIGDEVVFSPGHPATARSTTPPDPFAEPDPFAGPPSKPSTLLPGR